MNDMKFIVSKRKAINLATINSISISNNYLVLTTDAGANAREILFFYGAERVLVELFDAIMDFIKSEGRVFDCDKFVAALQL